jgi:intracellular sulfur oxidation DsrE/DsrF family protein
LEHVARVVNLYTASGVPLSHLGFVAVIYGQATDAALDSAHYRQKYGVDNPNLGLIRTLRNAGIDVAVCGQKIASLQEQNQWVDPQVTLALSGLTTIASLEHQGYVLVPL